MDGRGLVGSVTWAAIEAFGLIFVSFVTLLVLARLLGPTEFGQAATVIAIYQVMGISIEQLFAEILVQRDRITATHVCTAFWTSFSLASLLVLGCLVMWLANPSSEFDLRLLVISTALLPLSYSGVESAMLRRSFSFRTLAVRTLGARLAGAILGLVLAFSGAGAWSIILQQLLIVTMGAAILWVFTPNKIRFSFDLAALRELIGFAVASLGSELMVSASPKLYQLVAAWALNTQAFGYLSIALRLVDTLRELIGHVTANVGLPLFSRLRDNAPNLSTVFVLATSATCLFAMPVFVGLSASSRVVIEVILGPAWLPAVPATQILAAGAAIGSISMLSFSLLSACGRPATGLVRGTFDFIWILVLGTLVAPYGLVAAALVWATRQAASSLIALGLCVHFVKVVPRQIVGSLIFPFAVSVAVGVSLIAMDKVLLAESVPPAQRLIIMLLTGGGLLLSIIAVRRRNFAMLLVAIGRSSAD